jgi:hypothetical protein
MSPKNTAIDAKISELMHQGQSFDAAWIIAKGLPELREAFAQMAAGLTEKEAVQAIKNQKAHDAAIAQQQTVTERRRAAAARSAELAKAGTISLSLSRELTSEERALLTEWKAILSKRVQKCAALRKRIAGHHELHAKVTEKRDKLQEKAATGLDSVATQDHAAVIQQLMLLENTILRAESEGAEVTGDLRHALANAEAAISKIAGADITEQMYEVCALLAAHLFKSKDAARARVHETDAFQAFLRFMNVQLGPDVESLSLTTTRFIENIDALVEAKPLWTWTAEPAAKS